MSKWSACSFPFVVFGDDGFPFKAKIRTILENNPAGLLWCGGYIYFGRKVLYDLVYYQQVMTILRRSLNKNAVFIKSVKHSYGEIIRDTTSICSLLGQ